MALDTRGLTPLDTSGLTPAGSLNTEGLTPLDVSGLEQFTPETRGWLDSGLDWAAKKVTRPFVDAANLMEASKLPGAVLSKAMGGEPGVFAPSVTAPYEGLKEGQTYAGVARNIPPSMAQAAVGFGTAPVRGAVQLFADPKNIEENRLYKMANNLDEWAQEAFPVDELYREQFFIDVAGGVVSMAGFMAVGGTTGMMTRGAASLGGVGAAGLATATKVGQLAGAVPLAALHGSDEAYQRARQFGLDEDEAQFVARVYGVPAGVIQVANINVLLRALPPASRQALFASAKGHILYSMLSEFTVEGAGALGQNVGERTYNAERGVMDDVLYRGLIGALSSGITQAGRFGLNRVVGKLKGETAEEQAENLVNQTASNLAAMDPDQAVDFLLRSVEAAIESAPGYSEAEIQDFAAKRLIEIESDANSTDADRQEAEFIRQNRRNPAAIAEAYGARLETEGEQFGRSTWNTPYAQNVTQGDIDSPLPTGLIAQGKGIIDQLLQGLDSPQRGQTDGLQGQEGQGRREAPVGQEARAQFPTWDTLKPGDTVMLYRGEDAQNTPDGEWWTTDRDKAARYGSVTSVSLPAEVVGQHAARGHGGADEFVFAGQRPSALAQRAPQVPAAAAVETRRPEQGRDAETVEVPIGRSGKMGQSAPRYWYHNMRGRSFSDDGGIDPYPMRATEAAALSQEYKDGAPDDRVIYLSPRPLGEGAVRVDLSKVDRTQFRYTGQAEGYAILRGRIPAEAIEGQRPAPVPRAPINAALADTDTAVTPAGREIQVRYAVVSAADLVASQTDDGRTNPKYPAELQPRDRTRAASEQQIQSIIQPDRFNPRLLGRSPSAATGAPIISADGIVESGNGRILALRRAFGQQGESAQRYRDFLEAEGFAVPEGVTDPVLVRIRQGDMSMADRQAFTREANQRETLGASATEQAMSDAAAMPVDLMDLYRGGDVDAAGNRDFVRAFIARVVPENDRASMLKADGTMSQEAVRRIQAAMLAKAYGDSDLVAALVESADENIRAIGGALMDVSGPWAQMRKGVEDGQIDPSMDATANLLEAVKLVQRARREGRSLSEFVTQNDMLSGRSITEDGEAFLRMFFHNTQAWNRPVGRAKLAEALTRFVEQAERAQAADIFGDPPPPVGAVLSGIRSSLYDGQEADVAAQAPGSPGERAGVDGRGGEQADPGAAQAGSPQNARTGAEGAATRRVTPEQQARAKAMMEEARRANHGPAMIALSELVEGRDPTGGVVPIDGQLRTVKEMLKVTPPDRPRSEAPEHQNLGASDADLGKIVDEFNAAQASMLEDDFQIHHLFDPPAKSDVVRLADKVKVHTAKHGWMTPAQAKAEIQKWKDNAEKQGESRQNFDKVVLSFFDYTGEWSRPWEEAGYQVYRFDIQHDPEAGDVNKFSTEFFNDWFGSFDGNDIYAILAACPCTDFASSGARHFAAKDKDGRTVASVRLVHQTLAAIEYFKPAVWALENPVGRIEKLGGLPPWRLSFDPNHLGEDYTKKTLIWGRFNADLPIAPTEATAGSKMHSQYGGSSLATKNARSATPEGFAYAFFQANNAMDHPAMAVSWKYDRLDADLIARAIEAGVTEEQIDRAVEDFYYQELDDDAANQAIRDLIAKAEAAPTPAGEPALTITEFSDKSFIIKGQTKENIDRIKASVPGRGRPLWNRRAQGWVIAKKHEAAVRKALADLLAAPKAEAKPAAPKPATDAATQLAAMDDAALDAMFDEVEAEGAAPAKPDKARIIPTRGPGGSVEMRVEPVQPASDRTAAEIAASLGANLSSASSNAIKGLTELFGTNGKTNAGLTFDPDTYAKAKPHFQALLKDVQAAGKDVRDFVKLVIEHFGSGVRPYIKRFAAELREAEAGPMRPASPKQFITDAFNEAQRVAGDEKTGIVHVDLADATTIQILAEYAPTARDPSPRWQLLMHHDGKRVNRNEAERLVDTIGLSAMPEWAGEKSQESLLTDADKAAKLNEYATAAAAGEATDMTLDEAWRLIKDLGWAFRDSAMPKGHKNMAQYIRVAQPSSAYDRVIDPPESGIITAAMIESDATANAAAAWAIAQGAPAGVILEQRKEPRMRAVLLTLANRAPFLAAMDANETLGGGAALESRPLAHPIAWVEFEYGVVVDSVGQALEQGMGKDTFGAVLSVQPVPANVDLYNEENRGFWGMKPDHPSVVKYQTRNEYRLQLPSEMRFLVSAALQDTQARFLRGLESGKDKAAEKLAAIESLGLTPAEFWRNVRNGNLEHVKQIAFASKERDRWTKQGRWMYEPDAGQDDMFSAAKPKPASAKPVAETESHRLAEHFAGELASGKAFRSITEARAVASRFLGRPVEAGTPIAKTVDEAMELAAVMEARRIVEDTRKATAEMEGTPLVDAFASQEALTTYRRLVDLYQQQPTLGTRTSTSVAQQAYSTPLPLAFLAAHAAGIDATATVYEPSAGNGALVMTADPAKVVANELNPDRAANLRYLLPQAQVVENDAAVWAPEGKFDVVVANPPFGAVKGEDGHAVRFLVDEQYETGEIDHAISIRALGGMADNGAAVLIVGSVAKTASTPEARADAYNSKAKREFYLTLYRDYNVVDHFTVAGELYAKQGAGWPVDVIVIRGRGKSAMKLPAVTPPRVYQSWDALAEVFNARYPEAERGHRLPNPVGDREQRQPGRSDGRPGADGQQPQSAAVRNPAEAGESPVVRHGPVAGQPGDSGADQSERSAIPEAPVQHQRPGERPRRAPVKVEGENARQVAYAPASKAESMGTLVPVNMQTAVQDALNALRDEVGDLDTFVAERLGYDPETLGNYFGAEQVDAIALGLHNMEKGAGFIIGDQTGIGKGRVVAAMIRYALKTGRTPIFVTEKPNLYGDMYRDLTGIGIQQFLGREPKMLMTNAAENVPLDDEGTKKLKTGASAAHNKLLTELAEAGRPEGFDVVFTTYAQMQTLKGETTARRQFMEAIAPGSIIILDESHNAGGTETEGKGRKSKKKEQTPDRAQLFRQLTRVAHGVFYSSATYAKRPSVMDLYGTTDMRLAVPDLKDLAAAIQKGGVPMQQVVASMLAEAGQYIRRERSFDGVVYNTTPVPVSRQVYGNYSLALAEIQQFSETYIKDAIKSIAQNIRNEAMAVSPDGSVGGAGASSTSFTSVMHNLISQMLLSIKADAAGEAAVAALKRGEKPVITAANTMESFLTDYADDLGLSAGDRINIDFGALLDRYLDRTRHINIKKPFSKEGDKAIKHYITDAELGPAGAEAFRRVRAQIKAMDFSGLPVSPLDHIRMKIIRAGFSVTEITGRETMVDYRPDGAYLQNRPGKERTVAGRRRAISDFNSGKVDAILINQSGATGLSLHASEKFKNRNKRRMIIAQAEGNIDTHMQMLGRVHRTGQVMTPEYDQLFADVPAEKRPAAVLAKKMASLNATTTASRGGALTAENVPDFMNQYGDEIAKRLMEDMPEIHRALGEPLNLGDDSATDAMRKVTGRIPLLPIEQQEMLYEMLESEYEALLAQKEAAGESALEAKTLELDARVESRTQAVAPLHEGSPFGAGVYVEIADVKRLGKPYPASRVTEMVTETVKPEAGEDLSRAQARHYNSLLRETREAFNAYRQATLDDISGDKAHEATRVRLAGNWQRFSDVLRSGSVGTPVLISGENGVFYGVVTNVHRTGKAKNPAALSTWKVTVALASSAKQITIPMSQLFTRATAPTTMPNGSFLMELADGKVKTLGMTVMEAFDHMQTEVREKRTIITGNLLAGFGHVGGRGAIVNFTDSEGQVRQGILMPKDFDYSKHGAGAPVSFRSAAQVLAFLDRGHAVSEADNVVAVSMVAGQVRIEVAGSKARGGRYFLDKGILAALGGDFVRVGDRMRADMSRDRAGAVLEQFRAAGAVFQAKNNLDVAKEIVGQVGQAGDGGVAEAAGLYSGYEREAWQVQDRRRRASKPQQAPLDFDAPADVPTAQQQARDNFAIQYRRVPTQTFKVGLDTVTNAEEAAHVLAPIRKHAQEVFYALVLDGEGKILDVQLHTKGDKSGSIVPPDVVVPAIVAVDGAAFVWFAHNHPPGQPDPSQADYTITEKLDRALKNTGVTVTGHVVFGRGAKAWGFDAKDRGNAFLIKPRLRKRTVGVTESKIRRVPPANLTRVEGPGPARKVAMGLEAPNALILLDNRHQVIGSVAMTQPEMRSLRNNKQVLRLMRAIDSTNAAATLIKASLKTADANSDPDAVQAVRNLATFLRMSAGVRVLDAIYVNPYDTTQSDQEVSINAIHGNHSGEWFSLARDSDTPAGSWYFSALTRAAEKLPQQKGTAKQMLAMLEKTPGVKAEEVEWTGLREWLGERESVTRHEIVSFLRDNGVQVQEVVLGQPGDPNSPQTVMYAISQDLEGKHGLYIDLDMGNEVVIEVQEGQPHSRDPDGMVWDFSDKAEIGLYLSLRHPDWSKPQIYAESDRIWELMGQYELAAAQDGDTSADGTRYANYVLPGGRTYRELLLTLPGEARSWEQAREDLVKKWPGADATTYAGLSEAKREAFDRMFGTEADFQRRQPHDNIPQDAYLSSHWPGHPNVLAHIRFNERTDADGKRVLFIEEIQSDWHQQGRKSGYRGASENYKVMQEEDGTFSAADEAGGGEGGFATRAEAQAWADQANATDPIAVPDAPFKSSWHELALKRIVRWAAEHGYDRVAWTDGETQELRYWADTADSPKVKRWLELSKPEGIRKQAKDYFGSELASMLPLEVVDAAMLLGFENNKVRQAVIEAIPVNVVDVLSQNGFTPKHLFGQNNMVGNALSINDRATVARGLLGAIELVRADLRAALYRVLSLEPALGDIEILPAVRASDLDPRVVMRLLSLPGSDSGVRNLANARFGGASPGAETASIQSTKADLARVDRKLTTAEIAQALNRHALMIAQRTGDAVTDMMVEPPPGEGMRGFYDTILPAAASKLIKKYGAKVGPTEVGAGAIGDFTGRPVSVERRNGQWVVRQETNEWRFMDRRNAEDMANRLRAEKPPMEAAWGFDLTPALAEAAMGGMPLFTDLGKPRPTFGARVDAIQADLEARLKQVGIDDRVTVNVVDAIRSLSTGKAVASAEGRYFARLIEVAADAKDGAWVMDHEVVHALRDLGLFRDAEWRALERAVLTDKPRMGEIERRYRARNLTAEQLIEEAVADLHADYRAGQREAKGFVRTALEKIRNFLEALGNALRGNGFQSAADIFERINRGELGKRQAQRQARDDVGRFAIDPDDPGTVDLFGGTTRTAQTLADLERKKDQKRSPGRNVSADEGPGWQLFGQSQNQIDIEDVVGKPPPKPRPGELFAMRREDFNPALRTGTDADAGADADARHIVDGILGRLPDGPPEHQGNDGTLNIDAARIDHWSKDLAKGIGFFESATDKLRRSGNPMLATLGNKVDKYFDQREKRMGLVNSRLRPVLNKLKSKGAAGALGRARLGENAYMKEVQAQFREYWAHHDNNREAAARSVLEGAHPETRELVEAVKDLYSETGDINRQVGVQVYDANMVDWAAIERQVGPAGVRQIENVPPAERDAKYAEIIGRGDRQGALVGREAKLPRKGGWRLIGKVRRGNFWPRVMRPEVQRVLQNPNSNRKLWDALVDALMDGGHIQHRAEAQQFIHRYFTEEVKTDYFAGIEKARAEKLPEIFYDYSYDAFTRYAWKWADRVSQIEQFGQVTAPGTTDAFDDAIIGTLDLYTRQYVGAVRDQVYNRRPLTGFVTVMNSLNLLATAIQLGNPATATLNLIGGSTLNVQMFGWKRVGKAYAELVRDWNAIQQRGADLGILGKDVLNILRDTERSAEYFDTTSKIQDALSDFTRFTMHYGGYRGTENIIRATAMVAAEIQLRDALHAWNRRANSKEAQKYRAFMQRHRLDVDKLVRENGQGEETGKYLRLMVNIPQGSYRIDMVPLFADTHIGRFLFKYQKFGTQVSRLFYQNMLKPFVESLAKGGESLTHASRQERARTFLPMFRYFMAAFIGGSAVLAARAALFNYGDPGPDWEDLAEALADDDRANRWAQLFARAWHSMMAASFLGFFGNYVQFGMDVADQQRVKNPLEPPGLAAIDSVIELGRRWLEQGKLTGRDLDQIAEGTFALYRGYKRMGLTALEVAGADVREAHLQSARRDNVYIRKVARQYASEMGIEARRTSIGRIGRTPRSPLNTAVTNALLVGDAAHARELVRAAEEGLTAAERTKLRASVRASARNRQPIQIGGAPSSRQREEFLRWARENVSPANYERIVEADRRYRQAAARAGVW